MKYLYYLLFVTVFISCSKEDTTEDKDDEQQEQEENVVYYDTPWLLVDSNRIESEGSENNSSIAEKLEVQGRTYYRMDGSRLCEFDGLSYVRCTGTAGNFTMKKHNNTIYYASAVIGAEQMLETKIFEPNTFTFTNFSQPTPTELNDGQTYYTNQVNINDELHLVAINGFEDEILSYKLNPATTIWEPQMPRTTITRFAGGFRFHLGLSGEALLSGQTINNDTIVYSYTGSSLEVIHNLTNYTPVNGGGYFDILTYNGKYIIADGTSGTLRYLDGLNETSEAFPPQAKMQHFIIKGNYAITATGPTFGGPPLTVTGFRFYNLTNNKITFFTGNIDKNDAPLNSVRMESNWFDYTIENDQVSMIGNIDATNPNFTSFKGGARFSVGETVL